MGQVGMGTMQTDLQIGMDFHSSALQEWCYQKTIWRCEVHILQPDLCCHGMPNWMLDLRELLEAPISFAHLQLPCLHGCHATVLYCTPLPGMSACGRISGNLAVCQLERVETRH